MAAPVKYTARIVARRLIEISGPEGKTIPVLRITYTIPGFPPRTIWIDRDKATKENITKLIQEDLTALLERKVEVQVEGL